MSDIKWNSAPADATHWEPEGIANPGWMKYESGKWFYWPKTHVGVELNRGWLSCYPGIDRIVTFVKRPASAAAKSWNGEGLPPVGTVCSAFHEDIKKGAPLLAEILKHHENGKAAAFHWLDAPEGKRNLQWTGRFEPLRTPEQLAAERRAEAIKRAANLCAFPRADHAFVILEALYDNGLLKGSDDQ